MNVITDITPKGVTGSYPRSGGTGAYAELCRSAGRCARVGAAMRAGLCRLHARRREGRTDRHPAGRSAGARRCADRDRDRPSGRLPVSSAALVNGAASHALDFDDVNLAMPGHPSVVLLPALLALAEERGSPEQRCADRVRCRL